MSPRAFPRTSLADIKKPAPYSLIGGPFGSKLVQRDYEPDGVPVIRGANLPTDRRFSFNDFVFVSRGKVERDLRGNRAFPGDVVVTQRGTLGQVGLIPRNSPFDEFVLSQSQMKLTVDDAVADAGFVYYALKSPIGQHEIISRALTAGVPHINLGIFGQVTIPLPDLPTQRNIASVLSVYDELVENSRRRIELLEEMAQRLYREWFVEFRYPGHEGVSLVQSRSGLLPDGWERVQASDLIATGDLAIGDGYRAKNSELGKEGLPFVRIGDLRDDFAFDDVDRLRPESMSAVGPKASEPGDCIVCTKGTVGRVVLVPPRAEPFVYSPQLSYWRILRGRLTREYLVSWLRGPDFERQCAHVKGATDMADYVNLRDQRRMLIPIPPTFVQERFGARIGPTLDAIATLRQSIRVASATRDLLLPRLVAGVVDVRDLGICVDEVAS
jgi:type I restriction enzyme, S subunit